MSSQNKEELILLQAAKQQAELQKKAAKELSSNELKEVADAITSHNALDIRVRKTTKALRAAERAYAVSKKRYSGGLSTYLEVLKAEDSLITCRRAMAQIQARAFTLDVALAKALGGGFKLNLKPKE